MYRPASGYKSRSIPGKRARSPRCTWIEPKENRPYATLPEEDDRNFPREPYLAEDAHFVDARDYQHKGMSGVTDLREAQRLAANFFSQYPSASTVFNPTCRDPARLTKPLSPEVPGDRYSARGQYRDRDRWADSLNLDALLPSPRPPQLLFEDWEEERVVLDARRDMYAVAAARGRRKDDVTCDETAYKYGVVRPEADYPPMQTAADLDGGLRVTKRVDWSGLLQPDGASASVGGGSDMDLPLSKRAPSQTYRAASRPFMDSYDDVLEEELNLEGFICSRRGGRNDRTGRHGELDVRKGSRGYIDERLLDSNEYLLCRSLGSRGGERGGRGPEDPIMERGTSDGRGQRLSDSERGILKSCFENIIVRRPFHASSRHYGGGNGSGADRERDVLYDSLRMSKGRGVRYGTKRDFFQRASITNRDILAVYYGNQGPGRQRSLFTPTRTYPGFSSLHTTPRSQSYWPRWFSRSPRGGRPGRHNFDVDHIRKGRKRWDKPVTDGSEGKRFKRETQSDKLYLMHNSKAKSEEKERDGLASLSVAEAEPEIVLDTKDKSEASEPATRDVQKTTAAVVKENEHADTSNGLWINDDLWSDSDGEEKQAQMAWDRPCNEEPSGWEEHTRAEREQTTFQAPQSGVKNDFKKYLGECSADDKDDDADWKSIASDLGDQLDDFCVHQRLENSDVTPDAYGKGAIPTSYEAQALKENGRDGTPSIAESQDSKRVDIDNIGRSEEGEIAKVKYIKGNVGFGKKKVVVVREELQESVDSMEDKAFDYYVSLFKQDTDLMKLYEANVISGNFECLVCADVGAKKKKRFPDIASLVQHARKILRTNRLPEHRGYARAVCEMLRWETVPVRSVVLPRSRIAPQQFEPATSPVAASNKEGGDGVSKAGKDWAWAAARQLFEEQEAWINLTPKSLGDLSETGNSCTRGGPSPSYIEKADTSQGPDDSVLGVGTTTMSEETRLANVISVPWEVPVGPSADSQKASLIEGISATEVIGSEALSVFEKFDLAKAVPSLELHIVVGANEASVKKAVGQVIPLTQNDTVLEHSLADNVMTAVKEVGNDIAFRYSEVLAGSESSLVEMLAPLPRDEMTKD